MFWNTCTLVVAVLLTVAVRAYTPKIELVGRDKNKVTLECRIRLVTGDNDPIAGATFWLDDAQKLTDLLAGADYSSNADASRITFTLEQSLEGGYSCMNGTIPSDTIYLFSRPVRNIVDRYHAVAVNRQVSLECGVSLGHLESYYTPKWYKDTDTQVEVSAGTGYKLRRKRLEDFTLTILSPLLMDNGMYNCRVTVGITHTEMYLVPEMIVIELLVFEKPAITYMTGMTRDIIVVTNNTASTITFTCNVTGSPNLQISWYHKNKKIKENEKYSISTKDPNGDLDAYRRSQFSTVVIRNPLLVDSGSISCEAKISYRDDEGNRSNVINTLTQNVTSNLIVLDNKLLVSAIVTNDSDLLIQVYLRIILPKPLKLSLLFTPEDGETRVLQPDSTYSAVDTLYHFVPQSKIPNRYRRFFLQVALVVDQRLGPYNTPESNTIIDLDHPVVCKRESKCDFSTLLIKIVVPLAAVVIILIILIFAVVLLIGIRMKLQNKENITANNNKHNNQQLECRVKENILITKMKLEEKLLCYYGDLNGRASSDEERSNIKIVLETVCGMLTEHNGIRSDLGDESLCTRGNGPPTPVTQEELKEFIDKKLEKIQQLRDQLNEETSTQESVGRTKCRSSESKCSIQEKDQNHCSSADTKEKTSVI